MDDMRRRGPATVPGRSCNATRKGKAQDVEEPGARRPAATSKSFVEKEGFFGFMSKDSLLIFLCICDFAIVNGGYNETIIGNATKN